MVKSSIEKALNKIEKYSKNFVNIHENFRKKKLPEKSEEAQREFIIHGYLFIIHSNFSFFRCVTWPYRNFFAFKMRFFLINFNFNQKRQKMNKKWNRKKGWKGGQKGGWKGRYHDLWFMKIFPIFLFFLIFLFFSRNISWISSTFFSNFF